VTDDTDDTDATVPAEPPRALGFWMCLALVMGSMIGSGIFLLPAALAPFGWNAVYGWLITIAGVLCMARVFAHLARKMPESGGPYVYTRAAFGELGGFMVAWSYWISVWSANAAIAIAAVSYMSTFAPGIAGVAGLPALLAIALIWLFTAINLAGVAVAGRVQLATSILKLVPFAVVVVIVIVMLGWHGAASLAPYRRETITLGAISAAAGLTMWPMIGFEAATVPAGRVVDPDRTIPRATSLGTLATGLFYLVVCSGIILMMPAGVIARSNAPFGDFVAHFWAPGPAALIAVFATISVLGTLNGWVLVQGELPLALARDGLFPRWFGRLSGRAAPARAQIVSSALASLLVASNYAKSMGAMFVFMGMMSTAITLIVYFFVMAAALAEYRRGGFGRLRTVPLLAVGGLAFIVWALVGIGLGSDKWSLVLFLSGVPVYVLMRRSRPAEAAEDAAVV
jgi:APA family basic amino acid/polyamine antiporter